MYVLRLSRHRHSCDFRVPLIPYHHPLICGDRNKEDVEDMACPTNELYVGAVSLPFLANFLLDPMPI